MSSEAEVIELAIREMLDTTLPPHLRDTIGPAKAREWVGEHLDEYAEEKARFPDEPLLPWTNWLAYDNWELPTFFVVLTLTRDAVTLFCGTGYWPEVRGFGEGKAEYIPATELYEAWAMRFDVPCPPYRSGARSSRSGWAALGRSERAAGVNPGGPLLSESRLQAVSSL